MKSKDRSKHTPTSVSGPAPSDFRCPARRMDWLASSPNVSSLVPSETAMARGADLATCITRSATHKRRPLFAGSLESLVMLIGLVEVDILVSISMPARSYGLQCRFGTETDSAVLCFEYYFFVAFPIAPAQDGAPQEQGNVRTSLSKL